MDKLILKSDFDKTFNFIKECCKVIEINFLTENVKNGYRDYYIGQKIIVQFNDNDFKDYELVVLIIDILIEKEDNFALLVVPENFDNMFPSINPMLKSIGIDNLNVPKSGCFLAKHLGRDKFVLEVEEKDFNTVGIVASLMVPKLFSIPEQSYKKLIIFNKLRTKELPECINRILIEVK